MSLAFYYAPMSTASVTNLVLLELDIPHERIKLDLKAGDTHKEAFVALNPNARVPLLVHEGVPIFESSAITMYLGETFGVDKNLYPAPGPKRGEAMKWIAWANVTFGEAVGRWARNEKEWVPAEQRNAKAAEVARADIDNCLRILDEALKGRSFILGDHSLVDTHLAGFVDWLGFLQIELSDFSNVQKWAERCAERPAHKKLVASKE